MSTEYRPCGKWNTEKKLYWRNRKGGETENNIEN